MCEGLIDTLGRLKVGDWQQPFTAHPKLDTTTGGSAAKQPDGFHLGDRVGCQLVLFLAGCGSINSLVSAAACGDLRCAPACPMLLQVHQLC
jgi:hypothetical protein